MSKVKNIILFLLILLPFSCAEDLPVESQGDLPTNTIMFEIVWAGRGADYVEIEIKAYNYKGSALDTLREELADKDNFELLQALSDNAISSIAVDDVNPNRFRIHMVEPFDKYINEDPYEVKFTSPSTEKSITYTFSILPQISADFSPFSYGDGSLIFDINYSDSDSVGSGDRFDPLNPDNYELAIYRPSTGQSIPMEIDGLELLGDLESLGDKIAQRLKMGVPEGQDFEMGDQITLTFKPTRTYFRIILDYTVFVRVKSGSDSDNLCILFPDEVAFNGRKGNTYCMGKNSLSNAGLGSKDKIKISDTAISLDQQKDQINLIQFQDGSPAIFDDLITARSFTCGLSNSNIYCWSTGSLELSKFYNTYGEPGSSGVPDNRVYFTAESDGKKITDFDVGNSNPCYIINEDEMYCWGPGMPSSSPNHDKISGNDKVVDFSVGDSAACYINTERKNICALAYSSSSSQRLSDLYNRTFVSSRVYENLIDPADYNETVDISAGEEAVCAIMANGEGLRKVYCLGKSPEDDIIYNSIYEIDFETNDNNFVPDEIYIANSLICITSKIKQVYCSGKNRFPTYFDGSQPVLSDEESITDVIRFDKGICIRYQSLTATEQNLPTEKNLKSHLRCFGKFDESSTVDEGLWFTDTLHKKYKYIEPVIQLSGS